jgi:predicted nucleic acid-binding protein
MAAGKKMSRRRIVLDSSVALAWCFADEQAAYPRAVLRSFVSISAWVPQLWHLEMANAFVIAEKRKRCTRADIAGWVTFLSALPISVDPETMKKGWYDILQLARAYELTTYDAAYLELAMRRKTALASQDEQLVQAAMRAGVDLYQP